MAAPAILIAVYYTTHTTMNNHSGTEKLNWELINRKAYNYINAHEWM